MRNTIPIARLIEIYNYWRHMLVVVLYRRIARGFLRLRSVCAEPNWTLDDIKPLVASLVNDKLDMLKESLSVGKGEGSAETEATAVTTFVMKIDAFIQKKKVGDHF